MKAAIACVLALITALPSSYAQTNWVGNVTNSGTMSRSNVYDFLDRVEELVAAGWACVDVEKAGSSYYGVFVKSPLITDSMVMETRVGFSITPDLTAAGWRIVDTELKGYGMPGEVFYLCAYIKTDAIKGNGYFARSDFGDFIERKRESEDRDYYITDFECIDGSWWATTCRTDDLFRGYGTMSSRSSFSALLDRSSELNALGKRMVDIERIGSKWYGFSIKSDLVGSTGLFSRSSFSAFRDRADELEDSGKYLIDLEVVGGGFYGLVVKATSN